MLAPAAADLAPTPAQPLGPFYPKTFPIERDNDLARVGDRAARGQVLRIAGRVLGRDGTPVAGARVEIWQVNAFGRYHHEDDDPTRPLDPGFQGWGETSTDAGGGYRFRTIVPVAYTGRTPHVHFAVTAPGRRPFVTQMYLAGAPENAGDFLLAHLSAEARGRLLVSLEPGEGAERRARFDIVLP